jgi:starch synthase (maltosyl-transferring)
MVVSLNGYEMVSSFVHLDLAAMGLDASRPYRVSDLLHGHTYEWRGPHNYVELNPHGVALHIFQVEQ